MNVAHPHQMTQKVRGAFWEMLCHYRTVEAKEAILGNSPEFFSKSLSDCVADKATVASKVRSYKSTNPPAKMFLATR